MELKEAGFPQNAQEPNGNNDQLPFYFPTLLELIKECGSDFKCLFQDDPQDSSRVMYHWHAEMYDRDKTTWKNTMFWGNTPDEVVAKLYIALQNLK